MNDIVIIWDDEEDPDGNYWHLFVEGHGLTREEVEEVLYDEQSDIEVSKSAERLPASVLPSCSKKCRIIRE